MPGLNRRPGETRLDCNITREYWGKVKSLPGAILWNAPGSSIRWSFHPDDQSRLMAVAKTRPDGGPTAAARATAAMSWSAVVTWSAASRPSTATAGATAARPAAATTTSSARLTAAVAGFTALAAAPAGSVA